MTVLSGQSIRSHGILTPCHERSEVWNNGLCVSHGLGPAGYDLRLDLGPSFADGQVMGVPPGEFVLVAALEHFNMPANILGVVHDKSSWARRGLTVQNTVIEPGWRGFLTLELHNQGRELILLHQGAGIAQVVFHVLDYAAATPYNGKYQDQGRGPQGAR